MAVERSNPPALDNPPGYSHVVKDGKTVYVAGQLGFTDYLGLGESCNYYGVPFDGGKAHDALYDATKTAELALALLKLD